MEEPAGGGALSGSQREQLREKLALLRREYSETVSRLRRARRAERARSHGRGAAAEGGRREPSPTGSRDIEPLSADKHETFQLQTKPRSDLGAQEQTCDAFKHVPQFSSHEGGLQDSSQAESIQASQEILCAGISRPTPEEKKSQTSRSLLRLRRRAKARVSGEGGSVRDVSLSSPDETVTNLVASTRELQSPVFRQSSVSAAEETAPRAAGPARVQREENGFTPPSAASGVTEDYVPPGAPELFPHALQDSSSVWQARCQGAVPTPDNPEPAQPCSENRDSALVDINDDGGKVSPSVIRQTVGESMCEDQGELRRLLDLMSENEVLSPDGNKTVTNESKHHEGNQSDSSSLDPFPTDLALGGVEELLENQQLETQARLSPPEKAAAPGSSLSSCTVVEGLLFPVEYYVRTTRRMSSCQRKVDLDAIILSQLGRSKKGQRSKCKPRDANSDQPSQERAENDLESGVAPLPCLGAENDPTNLGSPQESLPASSGSSTSLGSISQSSITSTRRDRRRSQRKQKGRRKSASNPPGLLVSPELIESLDLITVREGSGLLSSECQSQKENCHAGLEKPPSDERKFSAAAARGAAETGVAGAVQPTSADPPAGGSQVLDKCRRALLELPQSPLQNSSSLHPGNRASPIHAGDLEATFPVCQADGEPAEPGGNEQVPGACRAELLPAINVPLRRSLRCAARQRAGGHVAKGPQGPEGPASLGLPAVDLDTCGSLFSFRSFQWLAPRLGVTDFHLPDEEFGLLKLDKLESSPVNDLEVFVPSVFGDGVASEDTQSAQMTPEEKSHRSHLISPFKTGLPKSPHAESPVSKKELSTHELLLTPLGTVLAGAPTQPGSQISSCVFPAVGATPAVLPEVHSEVSPKTPSIPPSLHSSNRASSQGVQDGGCKDSAIPLHLDHCGAGSAREEEEQGAAFPVEAERSPSNNCDEAVALEKHQHSESKQQGSGRASPEQEKAVAEQLAPVLPDGLREESLQLVSKLKDCSSSCAVDVSTMWWEAAGCRELCVVTACESSVSLWKPLGPNCWGRVYTWQLGEIPVIQIVPLPDSCNLACVALGDLEIGEIRLLLYSSENDSFKQSLVRTGNIKAALGLKDRRLVSSSRTVQEQHVEIVSFSETGRSRDGQTLMPPEETVSAFAEVEGMRDALVGTTAVNSVVIWNLKTGQLLKKMHVGYSYPASICHQAYSDSGLLFVVLSHPHAKESESCGNPAFRVVAFNPSTARSSGVLASSLPPGHAGRYLEGDVRGALAAAVLTSGAVAVWDLLLGQCTALLPPGPARGWALARWASTDACTGACLLAGQRDGTVCLYRYRQPQPGAA
ncbi:partner and localizer of BRCA2 isoform X2 [Strigops habroptila]|uniref:partner and localizer of BRCA2 isoform X2 n=1 Tax=Strigops habroptila TaxID=2489341 RepID=UPI0011CFDB70|nr:partner and localizer of BRCA2 isoform X2 [Strigops habroptila]